MKLRSPFCGYLTMAANCLIVFGLFYILHAVAGNLSQQFRTFNTLRCSALCLPTVLDHCLAIDQVMK